MKILVLPWDPNPYQRELYRAMAVDGHRVRFAGRLTGSQTANLLLLPAELVACRMTGHRVVHLHWIHAFSSPVLTTTRQGRRMLRLWFQLVTRLLALLGVSVVWIAHNVLPHEQVFDDDVAGRRVLLRRAGAVVVHSSSVLDELAAIGPLPDVVSVVRHPAYELPDSGASLTGTAKLQVLFFGNVVGYKGVPDLLAAAARASGPVHVTVAGACRDAQLRREIESVAGDRVTLLLEHQSDEQLLALLHAADVVALPFRKVTTSGSALYAMSAGRPVVLPDAPPLADLPSDAVIRYRRADPVASLAEVLDDLAGSRDRLASMGDVARQWARAYQWPDLAEELIGVSYQCLAAS